MTPDKKDLHNLGYFNRLHGYKGELTAAIQTDNIRDYVDLKHIFVEVNGQLTPFIIDLIEYKTNSTLKVRLEGIDTEEKAKALVKSSIYIDREMLSVEDDERISLRAIAGFTVLDETKGDIGTVLRIEEHSNNPLLVIQSGKKEILIPLNPDFFREINEEKKEVHISAPEGLIDFYLEQ